MLEGDSRMSYVKIAENLGWTAGRAAHRSANSSLPESP
jgi:hypothetical protein